VTLCGLAREHGLRLVSRLQELLEQHRAPVNRVRRLQRALIVTCQDADGQLYTCRVCYETRNAG
jgi:hypothetical protein